MKKELRRQRKAEKAEKRKQPSILDPIVVPPEGVPIFFVEPTGREFFDRGYRCAAGHYQTRDADEFTIGETPVPCAECDLEAKPWSASQVTEYRDAAGTLYRGHLELPVGAVYEHPKHEGKYNNWVSEKSGLKHRPNRQDGRVLCCVLPDRHSWPIDSRANNCTLPEDDKHWCWNRSGRPEDGTLDVRKGKPGQTTCSAGAGSIKTGRWHGFLHGGRLVQS